MARWRDPRRLGLVLVLAALVAGGAWWVSSNPGEEQLCTLGLGFRTYGTMTVVLEDQGEPGRDGCDASVPMDGSITLGLDCVLRDPGGATLDRLEPNRDDGTCGQPDPGGEHPRIDGTLPDHAP